MYLGYLCPIEEFHLYGYVSNTHIKVRPTTSHNSLQPLANACNPPRASEKVAISCGGGGGVGGIETVLRIRRCYPDLPTSPLISFFPISPSSSSRWRRGKVVTLPSRSFRICASRCTTSMSTR